jgi:hypothetical protein
MKDFIENNIAVVFVCMIVFGLGAYFLAGFNLHIMMGMAEVSSKNMIMMVVSVCVGSLFTILPMTFLYDIIQEKQMAINRISDRMHTATANTTAPRQRQEANHWQANQRDDDDDLDGDGEGDDSLRRLGVIR